MTDNLHGIDLDALLRELGDVEPGDEYRTAREWAAALGIGEDRTKRLIQQARDAGRLRVSRAPRIAIDGTRRSVPVYAIDVEGRSGT